MSKAFTSEELPDPLPVTRAPPRVGPGEARHVTPEGHAALEAELERLRQARAAAGSLPESEREARQLDLDQRIALAGGTLAALTVVGPEQAPPGRAAFATWVTVEDEAGARVTWRLVGPDEADARRGLLSVHSPVGRALIGLAEGERFEVDLPAGTRGYTLVEVRRTAP